LHGDEFGNAEDLMMKVQIDELENAARLAMGDNRKESEPLPPAPNYGPFGYFRLALLVFAIAVAAVLILNIV
jgi:hypothetical protein